LQTVLGKRCRRSCQSLARLAKFKNFQEFARQVIISRPNWKNKTNVKENTPLRCAGIEWLSGQSLCRAKIAFPQSSRFTGLEFEIFSSRVRNNRICIRNVTNKFSHSAGTRDLESTQPRSQGEIGSLEVSAFADLKLILVPVMVERLVVLSSHSARVTVAQTCQEADMSGLLPDMKEKERCTSPSF